MTGRRTWTIATRADPSTPIVRVHFRRPWYRPWRGRVDIEPLTDQGAEWAEVVEFALRDGAVHDLQRGRFLKPPHTRSVRRIELSLATITGGDKAIVCYAGDCPAPPAPPQRDPAPPIPVDWLRRRVEVAEVEAGNAATGRVSFAGEAEWEALKAQMRAGDELWEFESPPESWRALRGRAGYALVRGGELIDVVITQLS